MIWESYTPAAAAAAAAAPSVFIFFFVKPIFRLPYETSLFK